MSKRYEKSEALLDLTLKSIPLGTQTFSKSTTQFPRGVSPYFIQKGKGSQVWDVDGNQYTDFINSLAAITLGYNDPDVDAAVKAQMEDGVIFSLAHPIERIVAEKLIEMVPCAEKVRFGKNGSDATAGCVRLARAFTGRDRIAVCGYHGWQDWYIGSTARNRGVPKATRELTHPFQYNKIETLDELFRKHPGEFAGVIMEAKNSVDPIPGWHESVKELTHKHGALLIFDETITGFRYANGGAQELFGVTPDLASFGKGLANGYPVSAVVGRGDVMKLMEEIFFSFTFGGETLSLAAAGATLEKLRTKPVIKTMRENGERVKKLVAERIQRYDLGETLSISGDPTWSFVNFLEHPKTSPWITKTLFLQEMLARGIMILTTHNMSYAHTDADIDGLTNAYDEVLPMISEGVRTGTVEKMLKCKPLEPLFKLR
ncbi:MAG: aminotransferase class III-fold pyridoxal phosphate-dependent enzyme [Bdellovibrionales bacterium]|nr:aminotransferase class III-fold pyridoxal phosphate-dependent enzyme [Bdellovibrionales bacterium]